MSAEADLIDLWADIEDDPQFDRIRSGVARARLVPGFGAYRATAMVVADFPGAVETAQGKPFSGVPGQILGQLMDAAGLYAADDPPDDDGQGPSMGVGRPANAWMTYTIKYRVPGKTLFRESFAAQEYLRREWAIIGKPRVIVAVGTLAWETLGRVELGGIYRNAGHMIRLRGDAVLWPMLHPSYGMANEDQQPRMERHWEHLGDWLREENLL
jgi:uracil-DNA glycosylase